MKVTIVIFVLAAFSFASLLEEKEWNIKNYLPNELVLKNQKESRLNKPAGITAVLNDFADKIFSNIGKFSIRHKLDPAPIFNVTQDYLLAKIILNNGALHGISTIERYDDVTVTYQSKFKTLTLDLPVIFSNLSFTYDYDVKLLIVGTHGDLIGEIENFKFNLQLGFNFNTLTAQINKLKTTDSGHISLIFHGHLTDLILNILSEFITTILHPLIQGIIEGIIKVVANKIVTDVNDFIYNVTHLNQTDLYQVPLLYAKLNNEINY